MFNAFKVLNICPIFPLTLQDLYTYIPSTCRSLITQYGGGTLRIRDRNPSFLQRDPYMTTEGEEIPGFLKLGTIARAKHRGVWDPSEAPLFFLKPSTMSVGPYRIVTISSARDS